MKSKKDFQELKHSFDTMLEAEKERDRARMLAAQYPDRSDIADLVNRLTEGALDAYRLLVHRMIGMDEYKSLLASDSGRKGDKPPKRNPILDAFVKAKSASKNGSSRNILATLERMTPAERQRAIGQKRLPGLTTIKASKKRTG
jgi:hypothetical protein